MATMQNQMEMTGVLGFTRGFSFSSSSSLYKRSFVQQFIIACRSSTPELDSTQHTIYNTCSWVVDVNQTLHKKKSCNPSQCVWSAKVTHKRTHWLLQANMYKGSGVLSRGKLLWWMLLGMDIWPPSLMDDNVFAEFHFFDPAVYCLKQTAPDKRVGVYHILKRWHAIMVTYWK